MITRLKTIGCPQLDIDSAKELIYNFKEQIGKNEFQHLYLTEGNDSCYNYLSFEGKIDVNSVLFYLKGELMYHDDSLRIKYKTNAPMVFSKKVITNIENYFERNYQN